MSFIPGVGPKLAKGLIAHCGGATGVFKENTSTLLKIPGIGFKAARRFRDSAPLQRAEEELKFVIDKGIQPLFYLDDSYPERLKLCEDGPVLLYFKGNIDLNRRHALGMVGTRNATSYGLEFCETFIRDLKLFDPLIVSGLAYGIDIRCHKLAVQNDLPTIGVLGHGLDRVYPQLHTGIAESMMENGGLITEFPSGTKPDRVNFPKRNRIVAGICDAVMVIEAARTGGALITAEIANSYNREVFALPGKVGDKFSEGCNYLIKTHKASLINSVDDLKYILGWQSHTNQEPVQHNLFVHLDGEEADIWKILQDFGGKLELTSICMKLGLPVSRVLQILMSLELQGLVKSNPGKIYSIIK